MKKLYLLLIIALVVLSNAYPVFAQRVTTRNIIIQEQDGSPTGRLRKLKVVNGNLTDDSGGTFSLADNDTQLTQEQVEDFAGALVTDGTGTHTDITITYQDATGDVDFVVDTLPNLTGTLDVDSGGTGATSLTDGGILLGSGTGAITALGVATNGQIPIGDGTTDPVLATILGTANEIEITNGAGSITVGIVTSPTLDGSNFTGIPAGAYDAASIDGDDINSNIAGTFLTLTAANPDTLDVDSKLSTDIKNLTIESPGTADDALLQPKAPVALTINRVSCSTDAGTVTIQLDERVETTPNTAGTDIMTSTLVCDNNMEATTSFANAGIAVDNLMSLDVDATTGSPSIVRVHIDYTVDS